MNTDKSRRVCKPARFRVLCGERLRSWSGV